MTIRHVLLDADGVLQRPGGAGWRAALEAHLGDRTDAFVARLGPLEQPALTGAADFSRALDATLRELGFDGDAEELYAAAWLDLEVVPAARAVASELRAAGIGVHLATNQHDRRAAYMQAALGHAELLDGCFYSCELGLAKPDTAFFAAIAERLASPPAEVLLVDDSHDNVAGARSAGLVAEHWHHDLGAGVLRARLAGHGLTAAAPGTS